jgi:methionyl-tRNA formyltransferase
VVSPVRIAAVRIVFFGTPAFAVPALRAIAGRHEVAGVVAQPDKPSGRGMRLQSPAVVAVARELGLHVMQPARVRDPSFLDAIANLRPDAGVVIAYGRILPTQLLAIPPHGFINVHASLLPKYRGAAPIQRAIEAGETVTGVTIMRVDEQLDHGPVLALVETAIGAGEGAMSLSSRLSLLGATAVVEVLDQMANGTSREVVQDHERATHAAKLEKSEGEITFEESAQTIVRRSRAFEPWPGVFFRTAGDTLKVLDVTLSEREGPARQIMDFDGDGVIVATGQGAVRIGSLQEAGRARANASAVARAHGWKRGERIAD